MMKGLICGLVLVALLGAAPTVDAAGQPVTSATADAKSKAQKAFMPAIDQFEQKKFEKALDGFRKSYGIVASPNSHLYVARCLAALGHHVEAYQEMTDVIQEAEAAGAIDKQYLKTKQTAETELADLTSKLGLVTITIAHAGDGVSLRVAGTAVPQTAWGRPMAVAPGVAEIEVTGPDGRAQKQQLTLAAGERKEVSFDANPKPPPPVAVSAPPKSNELSPAQQSASDKRRRMRTVGFIATGIGVAGGVTFAVAGSLARSKYNALDSDCGGPCPAGRQSDIDAGKRDQLIANIGLGVGIAGIGTGVTLLILGSSKARASEPAPAPRASLQLVGGPSWVGVGGVLP